MKSSKLILAIWLAANAWAQNLPPKQQVSPAAVAKPNAASASKAAPLNSKATPAKVQANQPPAKAAAPPSQKPAIHARAATGGRTQAAHHASAQRRVERKLVRRSAVNTTAATDAKPKRKAGRDPFVSPVVERKITAGVSCSGTGRQCLVVGDITLQGVVRSPSGYIAVVVNGEHTYFLHEHDPLADGSVDKITRDAITLQQHSSDALGRPQVREVTKRLGVPAG